MKTNHIILPNGGIDIAELSTIKYGKILTIEIGFECDATDMIDIVTSCVESICNQRSIIVNDISGGTRKIWVTITFVDSLITGIVSTLTAIFDLLEVKSQMDLRFYVEGAMGKLKKVEEKQLSLIEEQPAPKER